MGIANYRDLPFVRIHYFYTPGSGNGLEGAEPACPTQLTLRKKTLFVIEKHIEDLKQDEKHVPDLLQSIMKSPGLVKEELRRVLFKTDHFGSKISKIKDSTFWIPEI